MFADDIPGMCLRLVPGTPHVPTLDCRSTRQEKTKHHAKKEAEQLYDQSYGTHVVVFEHVRWERTEFQSGFACMLPPTDEHCALAGLLTKSWH